MDGKIYKPTTMPVKPWEEIEDFFLFLTKQKADFKYVADLIAHIKEKGLSKKINASLSVRTLLISIQNPIVWNEDMLVVEYFRKTSEWEFIYYSKTGIPEIKKKIKAISGIHEFDKIVKEIKW